ncbi:hypothetical protein BSL78_22457 [Apostichopus japonicus]|uniref:Integrase core domain-containing protein n=2 Tax=Stichopus japonicus TaxID=307972 RepID=A0A2G8JY90_STIJA|nr:hypothetical protein BSL78_22457 [Apostichopus japonicus]
MGEGGAEKTLGRAENTRLWDRQICLFLLLLIPGISAPHPPLYTAVELGIGAPFLRDDLILHYWSDGFTATTIMNFLALRHGIVISLRQLRTIVAHDRRRRRNVAVNYEKQHEFFYVAWDPQGVALRSSRRIIRREYICPGPNYLIHIDGYDKLKQFGFPVHAAIDGFSLTILWLYVGKTNNNPVQFRVHFSSRGVPERLTRFSVNLSGDNCFDVRFTSEAARVRGVHVLEGVEGLKVTPYDSSVWVTVLHLPLDMSEQVVVRTLGRFGKVTGYEEPEFLECKVSRPGLDELESNSSPISPLPCGLMGTGPTLHTRASLALVGGVGWKGMRPDRSYAARVATGVVEAVPVPASDTVPHDAPVIAPVSDTSAPMEALFPLSCPTSPLIELAETASLPTEAEQDKTAEMVLAEWHAAQDAACTGSPVATPAIGDTSRAPSQPAQETLSGPDSDSPMEDCTTALLVVAKESSDWFDETKQATDLIDSSGPSTLPAAASAIPDTMVASGPPVPDREVHSIKVDEELRTLLPRKKRGNTVRGLKRPVLGKFRRLIQRDFDRLVQEWNQHLIRSRRYGNLREIPDVMYFTPEVFQSRDYKMPLNASMEELAEV